MKILLVSSAETVFVALEVRLMMLSQDVTEGVSDASIPRESQTGD